MKRLLTLAAMSGLICAGCSKLGHNGSHLPELTSPPAPYKEIASALVKGKPVIQQKDSWSLDFNKKFYKKAGIFCGDKALVEKERMRKERQSADILYLKIDGKIQGTFSFWGSSSASYGSGFGVTGEPKHKEMSKFDLKNKSFSYDRGFNLDKNGKTGAYRHEAELLPDGLVKVSYSYTVPKGSEKHIKDQGLFLRMLADRCAGIPFLVDGKKYVFPKSNAPLLDKKRTIFSGKTKSFVFNPDNLDKGFSIQFPSEYSISVVDKRLKKNKGKAHRQKFFIRIKPIDRKVSFMLDLRDAKASAVNMHPDIQKGIDFWKTDRLHVPDYTKCRNMVQNPSFEAGLRYYDYASVGTYIKTKYDRFYTVDNTQAKFGNDSLKIKAFGFKPTGVTTFALPVSPGKKYTVSCYVKGDSKGLRLYLLSISGKWPIFPKLGSCGVGKEWKRYSFSFVAPNNVIRIKLLGKYLGKLTDDKKTELQGNIWVDGLQMEEGALTDFVEKPIAAQLLTSSPDNFLQPKDKINAKLKIAGKSGTAGTVSLEAQDYFYRKLWSGKFDFKTNDKGIAVINLPLDGKLPKGIHVVRGKFELKNGFKETDYFRVAIMDFLKNEHRNKGITSCGIRMRPPRAVDIARRNMRIGMGGTDICGSYGSTPKRMAPYLDDIKILNRFKIKSYSSTLLSKDGVFPMKGTNTPKYIGKHTKDVTPEMLKYVEESSCAKAKFCYPLIDCWCFTAECTGRLKGLNKQNKMDDIARLHLAAFRGVKKFNPEIKFMATGGPCNMGVGNGILWLDRYLTAVEKIAPEVRFDVAGIHPYRRLPEDPDLDYEMTEFFKMLAKHGYSDIPVIFNEGIYFTNYIIPAWGLSAHKGCSADHYRAGTPSYHMGWGERISAAYWARSWLVGFKYQDRVKCFDGHYGWNYMDTNLTPFAVQKIPNTLGRMLGNAYFKKDIRFAPNVRCYVFEDEKKRPVAAMWSHVKNVDKGLERCPVAEIKFTGSQPEFIDLMEVERNVTPGKNGISSVPVSSFPLFIRGEAGTLDSFCKDLGRARLAGKAFQPLAVVVTPVGVSKLDVQFRNLISRPFNGTAVVSAQGNKIEKKLALAGQQSEALVLPLKQKLSDKQITDVSVPIVLKEEDRKAVNIDASFRGFAAKKHKNSPIKIDGSLDDWKDIPEIPITNRFIHTGGLGDPRLGLKKDKIGYKGDHQAFFSVTWDDDNLYLLAKVKDDKFSPLKKKGGIWTKDSLQVYIDTYCDARKKSDKGFDTNDFNYDFGRDPQNPSKLLAWRAFTPEWQLTLQGGLKLLPMRFEPGIKTAFKEVKGGYIYEIAFPKAYLAPMQFKAGTAVGFGLFLNDNDGTKRPKASLTLTPDGTKCYLRPHLYPVMMLTE